MSSALNGIDADTDAAAAALLFLVPGRKAEAAEMLPPISWNGHPPRANNTEPYRQPWAPEEDLILRRSVALNGARQWTLAAQALPGRSAKQCRERWVGALDPSIRQTPFTEEEDELVIAAYRILGSRWAEMAKILTGRTDNAVKNRANSGLRAQLWPNVRYRPRRPRRLTPRDNPPPVLAPFPSAPFESPVARVLERVPKSAILSASPRASPFHIATHRPLPPPLPHPPSPALVAATRPRGPRGFRTRLRGAPSRTWFQPLRQRPLPRGCGRAL